MNYGDNDGPGVDRYDSTWEHVCVNDECQYDGTVDVEVERGLVHGECPSCHTTFEVAVA